MCVSNGYILVDQVLGRLFIQPRRKTGVRTRGDTFAVKDITLEQGGRELVLLDDLVEGDVERGGRPPRHVRGTRGAGEERAIILV